MNGSAGLAVPEFKILMLLVRQTIGWDARQRHRTPQKIEMDEHQK